MIRINLLPIKQDRRREAGRNQVIIAFGFLLLEALVCWVVHTNLAEKVKEQQNKNQNEQAEVDRIKKGIQDQAKILSEIAVYERRQGAIESLKDGRVGPVYVMLELSKLMSKGGRPQIDNVRYQEMIQTDPTTGYNPDWDFRRVWLSDFKEKERAIELQGQGLTHEDVAEFLRRVNLSDFFVKSELVSTDLKAASVKSARAAAVRDLVVHFKLKGEVRYR
jgi:type IV pilus assembly protein PilN